MTIAWPIMALALLTAGVWIWAHWPFRWVCQTLHPHSRLDPVYRDSGVRRVCSRCGVTYLDLYAADRFAWPIYEPGLWRWALTRLPIWIERWKASEPTRRLP